MKRAAVLLLAVFLTACAPKQRPQAKFPRIEIPKDCILGGLVDRASCQPLDADHALCDGVVIKFACVKVVSAQRAAELDKPDAP